MGAGHPRLAPYLNFRVMDGIELQKMALQLGLFLTQSWTSETHYLAFQGKEPHLSFKNLREVEKHLRNCSKKS